MEERETPKVKRTKIEECVTDEGLLVSGIGILIKNNEKILEKLDSLNLKLFHMEKRDKERYEKEKH